MLTPERPRTALPLVEPLLAFHPASAGLFLPLFDEPPGTTLTGAVAIAKNNLGTIINGGTITGTGVGIGTGGGTPGAYVHNLSTGKISGATSGLDMAIVATLANDGTISSSDGGMLTFNSPNVVAIELAKPNSRAPAAACAGRQEPRITAASAT